MASISSSAGGLRVVQYQFQGKRYSIRLGKMSLRSAESFKCKIECIVAARVSGQAIDGETGAWIARLSHAMHAKIAKSKLIEPRAASDTARPPTLGEFIASYIAGRIDAKPNTIKNLQAAQARLVEFFGFDRELDSISDGDCDDWLISMKTRYAPATVGRCVKRARQFFKAAMRKGHVAGNPFLELKAPAQENESRKHFVERATIQDVIEACPDAEWRLIVALSRYGGLRCPSETLTLRLDDIDWTKNRIRVTAPKNEDHADGGVRVVPIFAELRPYLEDVFEMAAVGTEFLITRYRDPNSNLRSQMLRILKRAKVKPWPRLFHNLRASRETELMAEFPTHVVCKWFGNSPDIANKHYLQVREEDYTRAAKSAAPALQNAVQQPHAPNSTESHEKTKALVSQGFMRDVASQCDPGQSALIPPRGIEPLSSG